MLFLFLLCGIVLGYICTPISQVILKYLMDHRDPVDAETIWLDVKAKGAPFSIGSIYGHLKRMEHAGNYCQSDKS